MTECLEHENTAPAGLILIDTYATNETQTRRHAAIVLDRLIQDEKIAFEDSGLMAMGQYMRLVEQWQPVPIRTEAVLLRAQSPLDPRDHDDTIAWRLPESVIDIAADHFSIIDGQAAATARAVDSWIGAIRHLSHRTAPPAA
jgi:hypothetical protein